MSGQEADGSALADRPTFSSEYTECFGNNFSLYVRKYNIVLCSVYPGWSLTAIVCFKSLFSNLETSTTRVHLLAASN